MREVSGPIIAISVVLCAVFVPMAFMAGVTGQFYKQFAVTIAISTVISAINSLTLSPALAAKLLRGQGAPKDRLTRIMDRGLGWLFRPFNRFFNRSSTQYERAVGRLLAMRGGVFTVYLLLLGCTFILFQVIPSGFIPNQDKLYLFGGAQLSGGASLSRTDKLTREMASIAQKVEGVDFVTSYVGYNALQNTNTPNLTTSYIILKSFDERNRSADEINAEINKKYFLSVSADGGRK